MKTFGILKTMVFLISRDIFESFADFLAIQWRNRYETVRLITLVICGIVVIFVDILLIIILFTWVQHPFMVTSVIICWVLGVMAQIMLWIDREKVHKWFLDNWDRASQKYRRDKENL